MVDNLEILPKTVREILQTDNSGILDLCKAGDIKLRQNEKGLTYFTNEDIRILKRIQEVQNKVKYQEEKSFKLKNNLKKLPAKKQDSLQRKEKEKKEESILLLKQITSAVKNIEDGFYNKFALLLENKLDDKLEEKLGGIDEVILELVRSKSEAEQMRKTIAENTKEIYSLKNELSSYKKVFGKFYIKEEIQDEFDV